MTTTDSQSTAIQQEILTALRAGAEFRTAHKEGGTIIRWRDGRYVREDYGDWNESAQYTGEAEFLQFLWRFFEWESRGFQAVELSQPERWLNIQRLLPGCGLNANSSPRRVPVNALSRFWRIGAFVIAAAAVGLIVWLRGGFRYAHDPAPQILDTFKGSPERVVVPEFKISRPVH